LYIPISGAFVKLNPGAEGEPFGARNPVEAVITPPLIGPLAYMLVDVALVVVPLVITKFVDVPVTIERLLIDEEALFTCSAPLTERAVVEANVRVLFVELSVTTFRLLIDDDALLTIKAPETVRAVVDEKDTRSFTTLRLLIDEEAAFTIKPPWKYERLVVVAAVVVE
jgi:hypothetical protein